MLQIAYPFGEIHASQIIWTLDIAVLKLRWIWPYKLFTAQRRSCPIVLGFLKKSSLAIGFIYCKNERKKSDLAIDRGRLSVTIHARKWALNARPSRSVSVFERRCFGRNRAYCWSSVERTTSDICAACFSEAILILWTFIKCLAKDAVPSEARYSRGFRRRPESMHFWQRQTSFLSKLRSKLPAASISAANWRTGAFLRLSGGILIQKRAESRYLKSSKSLREKIGL